MNVAQMCDPQSVEVGRQLVVGNLPFVNPKQSAARDYPCPGHHHRRRQQRISPGQQKLPPANIEGGRPANKKRHEEYAAPGDTPGNTGAPQPVQPVDQRNNKQVRE